MGAYRVLAGHHYPSDVLAAEELTDGLFCEAFQADLPATFTLERCKIFVKYIHENGGLKSISVEENWPITFN
jgi:hypothetical protein